uniref:spore coat protein YlbD n=1 Tax=Bacillus sp. WP8 TaxID=756828 RepID=UPI0028CB6288
VMFGDEHEMSSPYPQSKSQDTKEQKPSNPTQPRKPHFISKILSAVKKIHPDQINQHINKITHSISSLQTLLPQ